MSTRCNVIISETFTYRAGNGKPVSKTKETVFYRHSDGYPETVLPELEKLSDWIKRGLLRGDLIQSSAWLVIIGAIVYNTIPKFKTEATEGGTEYGVLDSIEDPKDWKAGAYEITDGIHGDISYLYRLELPGATVKAFKVSYNNEDKQEFTEL